MTSKLKCSYTEEELKEIRNNFKGDKPICPFCQQELVREGMNHWWCLCNLKHQGKELYGTTALWQALIQAKQDLEIATKALKKIESTEWYDSMSSYEIMTFTAMKALEQIEHKEI